MAKQTPKTPDRNVFPEDNQCLNWLIRLCFMALPLLRQVVIILILSPTISTDFVGRFLQHLKSPPNLYLISNTLMIGLFCCLLVFAIAILWNNWHIG